MRSSLLLHLSFIPPFYPLFVFYHVLLSSLTCICSSVSCLSSSLLPSIPRLFLSFCPCYCNSCFLLSPSCDLTFNIALSLCFLLSCLSEYLPSCFFSIPSLFFSAMMSVFVVHNLSFHSFPFCVAFCEVSFFSVLLFFLLGHCSDICIYTFPLTGTYFLLFIPFRTKTPNIYSQEEINLPLLYHQIGNINFFIFITNQ